MLLGAAVGGILGGVLSTSLTTKLPLRQALEHALLGWSLTLLSLRRAGPFAATIAYQQADGHVWLAESRADTTLGWTQEDLDDWLFSSLLSKAVNQVDARHAS